MALSLISLDKHPELLQIPVSGPNDPSPAYAGMPAERKYSILVRTCIAFDYKIFRRGSLISQSGHGVHLIPGGTMLLMRQELRGMKK